MFSRKFLKNVSANLMNKKHGSNYLNFGRPRFLFSFARKKERKAPKSENEAVFRFVYKSLRPTNWYDVMRIVIAFSCLVSSKVIAVQVPFLFKHAVDSLNAYENMGGVSQPFLGPIAILVSWGILRTTSSLLYELRSAIFNPMAQNAVRSLTCKTFSHLLKMDYAYLLTQNTGAISRAIDRGQRSIYYIINSTIFNILPTILQIALVCYLLGNSCGSTFSFITMGTIGVYFLFTLSVTEWRTKLRKELNRLDSVASSKAIDTIMNFETIKYFNNEDHEVRAYRKCLKDYHRLSSRVQRSLAFLNWGQNFILTTGLTFVMVLAALGVSNGTMTVGDLVMVNGLLFQLSFPLNFIGSTYRDIKQSIVDLQSMIGILNVTPKIKENPNDKRVKFDKGNLSFKDVNFSYYDGIKTLNGLSFDVPYGKSLAIVGLSGSGKSTLFRLLYRFFDPDSGSITIDGHDIGKISLNCLRETVGVVPQEVVLFNDTIFHNIQYGKPGSSEEEVHSAAKKAQIHQSILKMPKGYETEVGERGIMISGGERQRIAIARMILKNPRVILCDEATSSLDVETEAAILQSIKKFARDKTSIFIAHRLSAICDADQILVMENGKILEQGSYYSLMSIKNGRFLRLWEKQAKIK